MEYKIDIKRIIDGNLRVEGWVLPSSIGKDTTIRILDSEKNEIDYKLVRIKRDDVSEIYYKKILDDTNFGFSVEFPYDVKSDSNYFLEISDSNDKVYEKLNSNIVDKFNTVGRRKKELILSYLNLNTIKRAFNFLVKEGPINFFKKTKRKLKGITVDYDYSEWYELTKTTDEELDRERKDDSFTIRPFYSIVIPVYDTKEKYLLSLFKSILYQTYNNFEVIVADATDYSKNNNNPKNFFNKLLNGDFPINQYGFDFNNIHIEYLAKNLSIADNTNAAISKAKGDYIVLCDHDDTLTYDALYEVTLALNKNPDLEFIYSDEDKVDMNDDTYFEPTFKPDFNLDMLLSVNYFCHLSVIKKDLLYKICDSNNNFERAEYNGAQDYDLFLRIINFIINSDYKDGSYNVSTICHIPKVLYHWRSHKNSTSKNVESKSYAFTNGEKAIYDFYKHTKINFPKIDKVEKGFDYGLYHTVYSKDYEEPLISIIIPNKDHIADLKVVIDSIKKSNYKNIEFIICENNSELDETFSYYENLKSDKSIKVVKYEGSFNYSKINNYAVKYSKGDYILFLNNDVEVIYEDSLHEMVSFLKRDDVGAVGARLLYKDNTYQHAGVVIGIGGIADHLFKGINIYDHTYMNRAEIVSDYNAVTAAALMTKREIFDKVSGFDENLAVAFNDIDFCLKIRELNKLIVYNPYSSFYHYESKSRGLEDTKEKVMRFNREFAIFVKKWEKKLISLDEYYNRNLTLRQNNFALRNLKYEKIGEPFPIPKEIKELMKEV